MVEQQMFIDQLKLKLEKFTDGKSLDFSSTYEDGPAVVAFARRPYGVPVTKNLLCPLHVPSGTEIQKGYTSPPILSLAQIMAEFHVRRQILLSKLEDQDKVLHHLSDQSDEEEDNAGSEEKTSYKHSMNRTWTQNHTSPCFLPDLSDMKCRVDKSGLSNKSVLQTTQPQTLQKKQQDTKNLASLSNQSEREARELEQKVAQMKHEQSQIQKKLCEESEKKKQLEAELQQDQQQIKELLLKMELQQKILKLKDKEIAVFKKKKNNSAATSQKLQKLEEQKKWLDEEMERILQQRQQLAELEEDLKKREAIVAKKRSVIARKKPPGNQETEV
ncbi:hypothetical protein DUI87_03764 [Hirundo rustica rustica]|uniref:Uncharacterized protein n=1 Tax=Hirundo rustica rustica TaxID=333673 RepID=A0A3M0L7Y6_HIRRU|nr:hypothetical protein DUI87_03764 [Hirundo rustica rustica]